MLSKHGPHYFLVAEEDGVRSKRPRRVRRRWPWLAGGLQQLSALLPGSGQCWHRASGRGAGLLEDRETFSEPGVGAAWDARGSAPQARC